MKNYRFKISNKDNNSNNDDIYISFLFRHESIYKIITNIHDRFSNFKYILIILFLSYLKIILLLLLLLLLLYILYNLVIIFLMLFKIFIIDIFINLYFFCLAIKYILSNIR